MHKPRKRFGQHFLHDQAVIQNIIAAIAPQPSQQLVEIGPGLGALTFSILPSVDALSVVEIDRDLIATLQAHPDAKKLIIFQQDALKFDFAQLAISGPLRVFGNLPYNISTPLIFHLLEYAAVISDMYFMLQKEVVDRMVAQVATADYGRLSVMVQYHCKAESLFDVPPESFTPPPKVNSSVVRLVPYAVLPHVAKNYEQFAGLVKQAFSQRRKTLRNSLKSWVDESGWEQVGIDSGMRPEELSVGQFVELATLLTSSPSAH
jgi:16S rRNA (adenine1518-N6/adenine1519-N6)-dimethyltransferase